MPHFFNPFKKYDVSEFPGVLVPLQKAAHRTSISAQRRGSITSGKIEKDENSFSSGVTQGLTIEALKAEVEADLSASGLNSSYDRKSKVFNMAIQDIGMGRYQWELFVLCGFGWLADKSA